MTFLEGILWLTLNVYHEARGESVKGQMAIVYITLNRAKKRNMTIKEVVLEANQFSWTSRPEKEWKPKNIALFVKCGESVYKALDRKDFTNGSTFFHSKQVYPDWKNKMKYVTTIGNHLFYKSMSKRS